MADNYLERKMEERREGGRKIVRVLRNEPGTLVVRFPFRTALVWADCPDERTALLLARLASTGCKVGLAGTDRDAVRRMAKARGATMLPAGDIEAAARMFAAIATVPELVFVVSATEISVRVGGGDTVNLGDDVDRALLRLLCMQ